MRNASNGVQLPDMEFERIEGLEVRELTPMESLFMIRAGVCDGDIYAKRKQEHHEFNLLGTKAQS